VATQTRSPTSDVSATGTWTGTAGTRFTLVDDFPDAAGVDFLTVSGLTGGQATLLFGFSPFTIPAGARIDSVQVQYYDQKTASQASSISGYLLIGGPANYATTSHNPANGTWTLRTDTWTVHPETGVAWTLDQVNGVASDGLVAFGVRSSDASPSIRVASIRLVVNFTYELNVDSGSYNIGATAPVNTAVGRVVSYDAATYTLTGSDVTLTPDEAFVGFRSLMLLEAGGAGTANLSSELPISQGSYTVTGFDIAGSVVRQMSIDPGSYTLSGSAVSVTADRNVSVTAERYTIGPTAGGEITGMLVAVTTPNTGAPISFALGNGLAVDPGSLTITGSDISFSIGRGITIEPGAYALTGSDVSLLASGPGFFSLAFLELGGAGVSSAAQLSVDPAAYTLTGADISFAITRGISVDPGAYTLNGADIAFNDQGTELPPLRFDDGIPGYWHTDPGYNSLYAYHALGMSVGNRASTQTVDIDSGAFTITFAPVTLAAQRVAPVDAGQYIMQGAPISLTTPAKEMSIDAGAYVLTGVAKNLAVQYVANIDPSTYTLTGTAVSFETARNISMAAGTYVLTGSDVTFSQDSPGEFEPDSYAITGSDVAMFHDRVISIEPGAYSLTGSEVTFPLGVGLDVGEGAYALVGSDVSFERHYVLNVEAGTLTLTGSPLDFDAPEEFEIDVTGVRGTFTIGTVTAIGYNEPNWTPKAATSSIWTPRGANAPKIWTPEDTGDG
jgi:hypothetical protein